MTRAGSLWRLALVVLCVLCLGAAALAAAAAAPQAAPAAPAVCPRMAASVVVDGRATEWAGFPSMSMDASTAEYVQGAPSGPADTSAVLRCAWDTQWLYFLTDVSDSILIVDSSTIADDDGIELALDGEHDRTCCSTRDHQFTIALDSRLADFGVIQGPSPLQWTVLPRPGGYSIEVAVPMSMLLPATPVSGTLLGFDWGINDDDDGGRRDKHLVWAGTAINAIAQYGDLLLAGPVSTVATPTATATTTATATATATLSATPTQPTSPPVATPTATQPAPSATPTRTATQPTSPPGGTPAPGDRLGALEGQVSGLAGALSSIWSIMQTAGYLPGSATPAAPAPTATPTSAIAGVQVRVNSGGGAYTDKSGKVWAADQAYATGSWGYLGGPSYQTTHAISGTLDTPLYQSERFNMTGYQFDLPSGIYRVELRFDEIYEFAAPNQRIFDVALEGTRVITGLDLFAVAGPFTAYDRSFDVTVLDGQLNIDFAATKGAAKINAIAVTGIGYAGPTPTPSLQQRISAVDSSMNDLETFLRQILAVFESFLAP